MLVWDVKVVSTGIIYSYVHVMGILFDVMRCFCNFVLQEEDDDNYEEEQEVPDEFDSDFEEDVSIHAHQMHQICFSYEFFFAC